MCTADLYYIEWRIKKFREWFGHSGVFIQKVSCQIKLEMGSIYRKWFAYLFLSFFPISLTIRICLFWHGDNARVQPESFDFSVFLFLPLYFLLLKRKQKNLHILAFFPFHFFWEQVQLLLIVMCCKLFDILNMYFYILTNLYISPIWIWKSIRSFMKVSLYTHSFLYFSWVFFGLFGFFFIAWICLIWQNVLTHSIGFHTTLEDIQSF